MIARILLCTLVSVASAVAAPVPKELKQKPDNSRMRGVWKEADGTRWYFDGEKLYAGGQNTTTNKGIEYDMPLRPNLVPPEFDLMVMGKIQYSGIYKFSGDDELLITYCRTNQARPTDIAQANANRHTLKREGEEKK